MIKKLLFSAIVVIAFFAIMGSSKSQSLSFCESVDRDGYPITESSVFNIRNEGDYVTALVRLPYEVACYGVRYEVYRNGTYDNTINQDTERNWVWFYKQISFYKTGTYTVYVYDCNDYMLCSGTVKIQWQ
jgi:hypothetical protein